MKSESHENENAPPLMSLLPTTLIQNLVDNYHNNQLSFINENLGMQDAHSIWFDLPTLKSFIQDIEAQATIIDPNVTDADLGIRCYYAAYPETPASPVPVEFGLRHTLVMVPTKKQEGLNYDFNPCEDGEEQALALTLSKPNMALAQNHGQLVPPGSSSVESY